MLVPHGVQSNRRSVELILQFSEVDVQFEFDFVVHVQILDQRSQLIDALLVLVMSHATDENQT